METPRPDHLSDHLPAGLTLRRFLVSAYGPTLLASLGFGAVVPMLALQAMALGTGADMAAFIAALVGVGQVLGDLPAGILTDRFGERRALAIACLVDAGLLTSVFFVHQVGLFAVIVFAHGLTGAVFSLARQTYLTVVVPLKWRARAMSSLGGVMRVGYFVGPLAGALIIRAHGIASTFLLAGGMALAAAVATLLMPDVDTGKTARSASKVPGKSGADGREEVHTWSVLKAHRHTLLTIGWGILALMLIRTARQVYIPLWCDANGIDAATTNLVYAASMAAEVLLFFPGGVIMDRLGRWWVTVPTMAVISLCFAGLPWTHSVLAVSALSILLGVANGISSGIVSTLGADVSPDVGRPQFLAGWRVFSDVGSFVGPLVISLTTAVASLAAAGWVLAGIGWIGTLHLGRLLPRHGQLPASQPRP